MKLTVPITVLCCGLAFFAACSKSGGDSKSLSPTASKLVAGKWQMTALTETTNYMGKDTTIDAYATTDACKKDNFDVYTTDGTITEDEGANLCPGKSQTNSGAWALLNNDTRLAIVDSNPDTADVLELTSTEMKLQFTFLNSSNVPVYEKYTFTNIK